MIVLDWFARRRERREQERAAMDAVALMRGADPDLLKEAAAKITAGRFVLVGTMALRARGYAVSAADLDFLCARAPGGDNDGTGSGGSTRMKIRGVEVDYIYADDSRRKYLTRNPDIILGVPVASVKDTLGLKSSAAREKDRKFMEWWRQTYEGRAA